MIQDIFPYHLDNQYKPDITPTADSFVIAFQGHALLLKLDAETKTMQYPRVTDFAQTPTLTYLFAIDDETFFLSSDTSLHLPAGYEYHDMKDVRSLNLQPRRYVFAAFTAFQLADWYRKNTFCGQCGTPTIHDDVERAKVCPECHTKIYPRINPAVIIGVTNQDKLLITRYRTGYGNNALVAGFTEIGETLEDTVAREVMEETGIKVKNIRYYKSQPWGIASDILAGFFCEVDGDDTIVMDETELKYAEWVAREDIVLQPLDYSLTNEMMQVFKEKTHPIFP